MTRTLWISTRIAPAIALAAASLAVTAPAAANDTHQIAVYGSVAPRCWVAEPARTTIDPAAMSFRGRAICNQAQPVLLSELRAIGPDGLLVERLPATAVPANFVSSLPPRTALEIVVSPQI
ncbi:hypothetical protein [Sphingopyxis sp. KK2]|uniref:hypothetical protein n=1 Tax=Sphingopyxis sp. KK2 TaxID=1855727 RepID=UPI0011818F19|nr:hypothetical protein [Sphingopyxis sp. KK2]